MPANGTLDILGRTPQVVGRAYSSDEVEIAIAARDHQFMLVQNLNFNYTQAVTRLFDLENSEFQAYVASRPQGNMAVANIVSDLDAMIEFLQKYGDVCQVDTDKEIVIEINGREADSGLCRKQGGSLTFAQPVLVSTTMSIAVADYVINNNMAFIFAAVKSGGAVAGTSN